MNAEDEVRRDEEIVSLRARLTATERERDEAREEARLAKAFHDVAVQQRDARSREAEKAERERDEARATVVAVGAEQQRVCEARAKQADALVAERDRLRGALEKVVASRRMGYAISWYEVCDIARAALSPPAPVAGREEPKCGKCDGSGVRTEHALYGGNAPVLVRCECAPFLAPLPTPVEPTRLAFHGLPHQGGEEPEPREHDECLGSPTPPEPAGTERCGWLPLCPHGRPEASGHFCGPNCGDPPTPSNPLTALTERVATDAEANRLHHQEHLEARMEHGHRLCTLETLTEGWTSEQIGTLEKKLETYRETAVSRLDHASWHAVAVEGAADARLATLTEQPDRDALVESVRKIAAWMNAADWEESHVRAQAILAQLAAKGGAL